MDFLSNGLYNKIQTNEIANTNIEAQEVDILVNHIKRHNIFSFSRHKNTRFCFPLFSLKI